MQIYAELHKSYENIMQRVTTEVFDEKRKNLRFDFILNVQIAGSSRKQQFIFFRKKAGIL